MSGQVWKLMSVCLCGGSKTCVCVCVVEDRYQNCNKISVKTGSERERIRRQTTERVRKRS